MEFCGFRGGACVAGREPGCAGHWSHFGDCAIAPTVLGGEGGAAHTSQRQVAKCKQLILAVRPRSCCSFCWS